MSSLQFHRFYLQSDFDTCTLYNNIDIICKMILTRLLYNFIDIYKVILTHIFFTIL